MATHPSKSEKSSSWSTGTKPFGFMARNSGDLNMGEPKFMSTSS